MKPELIQDLALIYVKAHTTEDTSVEEVYEMYTHAENELKKIESKKFNDHVSSPDFSL